MEIRFLEHTEIDKIRWDELIYSSFNGTVYACSWFLDIVAPDWCALVEGDYEVVMALPTRKKYGISYIFLPAFCQQLGVVGRQLIDAEKVHAFIRNIPSRYSYIETNLNIFNQNHQKDVIGRINQNFELDLIQGYPSISGNYSKNQKKNLKIAQKNKISIAESLNSHEFLSFYEKNLLVGIRASAESLGVLRKIITQSQKHSMSKLLAAYDQTNNLVAVAFILQFKDRSILLASASNQEGRETSSMYALIDAHIRKHSGSNLILDFEGSNIESIAYFFGGFGAVASTYLTLRINRLPCLLRWMKRS